MIVLRFQCVSFTRTLKFSLLFGGAELETKDCCDLKLVFTHNKAAWIGLFCLSLFSSAQPGGSVPHCLYIKSWVSTLTLERREGGELDSEQLVLIALRFIYTVCRVWIRGWKNATDCEIAWFLSGMLESSCAQSSALILGPERGPSKETMCISVCVLHPRQGV